ncbi:hypothetical protein [Desulfosporosinus lacus]|uniref:Uncharacterized protein n=1 Tax=Desulfosporosinus lacus DSM 15449 TaxID=1121420 RepID=A0A1M5QN21_9FIRM|nr:hypothetical protein [Desulfosporosinus lacus]SHH15199.1 hypothetical protein SAMN02746098_00305 [Desulfosporosinus lacus DSM 15449]
MRVITLDSANIVVGAKNVGSKYILQPNDIITDLGEVGQIKQGNGHFMDDPTPISPPRSQPTIQDISDNQLILMEVLATMYEDMLAKGTV